MSESEIEIDVEAWLARLNQNESLSEPAIELLRETIESVPDVLLPLSLKIAARDQGPMAGVLTEIIDHFDDLPIMMDLAQAMPLRTINLIAFAPVLERRILFLLTTTGAGAGNIESKTLLAKHSNNLAVRLLDIGELEAAHPLSEAATQIFEEIADRQPGKFLPDLAAALNTQALISGHIGKVDRAIKAASEAVEIYRGFIQNGALHHRENLALSLKGRADRLSRCDPPRLSLALRDVEESVAIYRSMDDGEKSAGLAASLVSLANHLLAANRPSEALKEIQSAKKIYDYLQARDRDEFLPALAACLLAATNCRSANHLWPAALEAAHSALDVLDLLRRQNTRLFEEDYAFAKANIVTIQLHLRD